MKKCGIFVLGRNALGDQIHVLIMAGVSLAVTCRKSVPTLRCPFAISSRSSWSSAPRCLATGSSNTPDTAIVLHVDKSRSFADGVFAAQALQVLVDHDTRRGQLPQLGRAARGGIGDRPAQAGEGKDRVQGAVQGGPDELGMMLQQMVVRWKTLRVTGPKAARGQKARGRVAQKLSWLLGLEP